MSGGAQLLQYLRRDQLMLSELRTAVHDAMPNRRRLCVKMLLNCRCQCAQRILLRLKDALPLDKWLPRGRKNVKCAVAAANAVGASRQHCLFIVSPTAINPKLQRRRATVQYEN